MKKTSVPDAYLVEYDGLTDDWISTSALSMLMMCGMAFYYKYILRWHEPISVRMTAGSGAHKGREVNLKQKIDSEEDMAIDDVRDAARDDVEDRFDRSEYVATSEFEGKSKQHACDIAKDLAVEFVSEDYRSFQTEIRPLTVEESIAVKYEGVDRAIVGRTDLREENHIIDDLKTSKSAFGQSKTDNSMGLSTYGLLTLVEYDVLPPKYRIHNVSQSKTGCKSNLYETTRSMEDIQRQLMRFVAGIKAIEAGNFIPCNPEHWKCSREYCGFFQRCPFGSGAITKQ